MIEVSSEFWRLTATISATMIGLVFLGTFYYLEGGWRVVELFRTEMEEMTVGYAKIIISYFSIALLLSLFQEAFVFTPIETAAFLFFALVTGYVTWDINRSLKDVQTKLQIDFYTILRAANWVLWVIVFIVPAGIYYTYTIIQSGLTSLSLIPEVVFAWVVLISLIIGYWNLIQFLLTPHQFHKRDRQKEDRENKNAIEQNKESPNEKWNEKRRSVAEDEIKSELESVGLTSRTNIGSNSAYISDELSAALSEPKLRMSPDVSEVGEAMVHVVIPDEWYSDGDLLNRSAILSYNIAIIIRNAYKDLTGVEVRIWRIHVLPWDENQTSDLILKLRWHDNEMDALNSKLTDSERIIDSASDVLIDSCLFPLGLTEEDFDPAEREPSPEERYSIYEIHDSSNPMTKRYDAKIIIDSSLEKEEIVSMIPELVKEICDPDSNELADEQADVVTLHLFSESRHPEEMISNDISDHFICRAEWFDPKLDPKETPTEMSNYNDEYNDIRIKWTSSMS
jgi:hypothetical protein